MITLIAQAATLPRMPSAGSARLGTLVEVLRRHGVGVGMHLRHAGFHRALRLLHLLAAVSRIHDGRGRCDDFRRAAWIWRRKPHRHHALRLHARAQSSGDARVHAPRNGGHLRVVSRRSTARWGWISRSSRCGEWRSAPCRSLGRHGSPAPFPTKRKAQAVCSSPRCKSPSRSEPQAAARSTISRERPPSSEPAPWFWSSLRLWPFSLFRRAPTRPPEAPPARQTRVRFYLASCGDDFLAKGTQSKAPMVKTAIMIHASLIA